MNATPTANDSYGPATLGVGALFCLAATAISYLHWRSFEYHTFDLAFYVQALWQGFHGHTQVSLLNVPLLGNHVEPIVFLIAPLFALVQHPLTLVVVQNALLGTMAPVAYGIGRELGFAPKQAASLALALLIAPATWFMALHEFHPEVLAAPLLLLMLRARLHRSVFRHWLWFLGVLACKENLALLLIAYCVVHLAVERKRSWAQLRAWYGWPLLIATVWFIVATKLILPALNSGNVDYLALYDRLGSSPVEILRNAFHEPARIFAALSKSLGHGNLLPALLLPFLALPLGRPRWLLISTPILAQHLLSWRSSEWMIYFHYAAPLLPLFWFGMVETLAGIDKWSPRLWPVKGWICAAVLVACGAAQVLIGPAPSILSTIRGWPKGMERRERQQAFLSQIPAAASVTAPLPYLSHLAMRPQLYSLHHVLKGLRTLSRTAYEPPPPPDFVLIDYSDSATFDANSGYYHPKMQTSDGRVIPSSDCLLHDMLQQRSWTSTSSDELTLLQQIGPTARAADAPSPSPLPQLMARMGAHTQLLAITKDREVLSPVSPVTLHLQWFFDGEREVFPWMELHLTPIAGGPPVHLTRGLCAPEAPPGRFDETWSFTSSNRLPPGDYSVEALFFDNSKRAWSKMAGHPTTQMLCPALPVGLLKVNSSNSSLH